MYYNTGDETNVSDSSNSQFTNFGELPDPSTGIYPGAPQGDTYDNILTPAQQRRVDAILAKVKKEYDAGNREVLIKILNMDSPEAEVMRRAVFRHVNDHPNMYAKSMEKTLKNGNSDNSWSSTILKWLVGLAGGAAGVSAVASLAGYPVQEWSFVKPIISSFANTISDTSDTVKGYAKEAFDAVNPHVRRFRDSRVSPEQYKKWEEVFQRTGEYPSRQEVDAAEWEYMKPSDGVISAIKSVGYTTAGLFALSKVASLAGSIAKIYGLPNLSIFGNK